MNGYVDIKGVKEEEKHRKENMRWREREKGKEKKVERVKKIEKSIIKEGEGKRGVERRVRRN